jgi:hypothetical protein
MAADAVWTATARRNVMREGVHTRACRDQTAVACVTLLISVVDRVFQRVTVVEPAATQIWASVIHRSLKASVNKLLDHRSPVIVNWIMALTAIEACSVNRAVHLTIRIIKISQVHPAQTCCIVNRQIDVINISQALVHIAVAV